MKARLDARQLWESAAGKCGWKLGGFGPEIYSPCVLFCFIFEKVFESQQLERDNTFLKRVFVLEMFVGLKASNGVCSPTACHLHVPNMYTYSYRT